MVTLHSPFRAAPRMSREGFVTVLRERGSYAVDALWAPTPPAQREAEAGRIYDLIVARGHDPAVQLAIAGKEHTFGTNRGSVLWRNNTRSWTNARTVRDRSLTGWRIVQDAGRGSKYVAYASVFDSVQDGLYRVDEEGFEYRRRNANSIIEVISIWAPGSDGNLPQTYAQTMCDWINEWSRRFPPTGEAVTTMDTTARIGQRVAAHNVEVHDIRHRMPRGGAYPRFKLDRWTHTAVHYTAAWRERNNLEVEIRSWIAHANFHVNAPPKGRGWPGIAYCIGITPSGRVLLLRDIEEMGYHAFNANEIAVGISCDTTKGQTPTPEMLRALNIVLKVLHEETPELPNLVRNKTYAHKELGFYDNRNYGTDCCGDLISYVARYRKGEDFVPSIIEERPPKPDHAKVDVPGIGERWVVRQIFLRWSEPKANIKIFGLPLTGMVAKDDGAEEQIFERAIMRHVPEAWPDKHDVLLERIGVEVAKAKFGDLSTGPFASIPAFESTDNRRYFPETGHSVSQGFKMYWEKYGDLDYFGLPISEEFTDEASGLTVQYFERARFEWHPGSDPHHYDVVLGRLGAEAMTLRSQALLAVAST
jgi:hypothetical protein